MKDLLPQAMKDRANRLRAMAAGELVSPMPGVRHDGAVDFREVLKPVIAARRLREMALAVGVSHSRCSNISNHNTEPSFSLGCKILKWVKENM